MDANTQHLLQANAVAVLTNASKTFVGTTVLHSVDLDIRAGEVHALMGENGAGKSTVIKILAGLHQPDEGGSLAVMGRPVQFRNPGEAIAAGIATVHQELLLFPDLTVAENIFMGHYPRQASGAIDWKAARRAARQLLDELDAAELDPNTRVFQLSVAQRQRVEIARALSRDAKILIMDEPTAALAEKDVERLLQLVRVLRERGVGILYVSHRMSEIFQIADRLSVLRDGVLVGTRNVGDVNEAEIVNMMVGRPIDQMFPKLEPNIGGSVLEVRGLTRGRMVRDISFRLHRGEILGIAGLVGSGRTELAHTLFGLTPAERGTITVDGQAVKITSPNQARDLGIAYVPEDRGTQGLVKSMDIRSNVSMAILNLIARFGFLNPRVERDLAAAEIRHLGIRANGGVDQIVGSLSGGNQQKVVLAKWLETKPKILILDEPTRGVDVGAKAEIHKKIGELVQQELAIIIISSELPEIIGMSDRVIVMNTGRIAKILERKDINASELGKAMTGEVQKSFEAENAH